VGAANVSLLQNADQGVLGIINTPMELLLGRPLIGNGANGTAASPNGQAGGLLFGNGGSGYSGEGAPGNVLQRDQRGGSHPPKTRRHEEFR